MSVENPAFRMELFHDTSIHPPFPNIINNNRNNNNNNNNNDITTPKTIDNDITTPKTVITADIHNTDNINNTDNNNHLNNNNNNESFGMTGNSNANNNHGDSNSLPHNWRYNEEHNINTNNINNLQCNTINNNNNQGQRANSYDTVVSESWSHEEWEKDSEYYKSNAHYIDNFRGSQNNITDETIKKTNSYDTVVSESWSHEEWDNNSEYYRDNGHYIDNFKGSQNNMTDERSLQYPEDNNNVNNTNEPLDNKNEKKKEMNNNKAKIQKKYWSNDNDEQYLSAVKLNTDDKDSLDSVPTTPPPAIPFQLVWVSKPNSTQGSLTNENVYESIELNLYSMEAKLNSNPEPPIRHSTMDMTLPANQHGVIKHSPSCPMFIHKESCPNQRRRSLPLVSRVPKMQFIANLPHDSVIVLLFFI